MKKILFVAVIGILLLTSCSGSRNGYGCKGNESWKKMNKRINNGY